MNFTGNHNSTAGICLTLIFLLFAAGSAFAHDPGLSFMDLKLEEGRLKAQIAFSREEIAMLVPMDSDNNGTITPSEFDAARSTLETTAREALLVSIDGKQIAPTEISATLGESNALHFNLNFPAATGEQLNISSPLIARLARGHRQFLKVHDERGNTLAQQLLDASNNTFETALSAFSAKLQFAQTFWQFFKLGITHILLGFDHLAFLFALLIAGSSFREAAKIITSFTAAHSITLALATFDIVRLSPGIVEPLIAVSIIYVGLENIFRYENKKRWLLTFGFGLIHGFGFASVLREIGIGAQGTGVAIPLFSFNLGVEAGQIAIAALVLPLIWKLHQQSALVSRYIPACSVLIVLAGGYWLIERILL